MRVCYVRTYVPPSVRAFCSASGSSRPRARSRGAVERARACYSMKCDALCSAFEKHVRHPTYVRADVDSKPRTLNHHTEPRRKGNGGSQTHFARRVSFSRSPGACTCRGRRGRLTIRSRLGEYVGLTRCGFSRSEASSGEQPELRKGLGRGCLREAPESPPRLSRCCWDLWRGGLEHPARFLGGCGVRPYVRT